MISVMQKDQLKWINSYIAYSSFELLLILTCDERKSILFLTLNEQFYESKDDQLMEQD